MVARLTRISLLLFALSLLACGRQEPARPETSRRPAPEKATPATAPPAGARSTPAPPPAEKLPEGVFDSLARKLPADRPAVSFREVARVSGLNFVHSRGQRTSMLPEDMGSGAAWGDYNNDGFPDLYVVNQTGPFQQAADVPESGAPGNHLYRNNGDGTFTDVTTRAGVGFRGFGMGAFWGDYDNDGCLDLYVTNYGRSLLYHNNCNGTFTDATDRAGVGNGRWATGATWFDYDRDGWLDLYVCNYVSFDPAALPGSQASLQYGVNVPFTLNPVAFDPQPNRLFRNNHNGTFTDVTARAGVADAQGRSLVVTAADFDNDGWPDLYIGNDVSDNTLYRNLGNGRFADVSAASATKEYRGTMGIAVGDFDEDGDLDFFLTHWVAQANALYQNLYNELGHQGSANLFFTDTADLEGVGSISMNDVSWGTAFVDFDNDGRLDLMVVNGSTLEDPTDRKRLQPQKPRLFWNQGKAGFFDLAPVVGGALGQAWNARGLAAADYDNDGDVDFVMTTNRGRLLLLRNDGGNRHHWLALRLRGVKGNREGIGTKVWLTAGSLHLYAEAGTGGTYLSQSSSVLHFGLGDHKTVDRLELLWPSGTRQRFENFPANRLVEVVESGSEAGLKPLHPRVRP